MASAPKKLTGIFMNNLLKMSLIVSNLCNMNCNFLKYIEKTNKNNASAYELY